MQTKYNTTAVCQQGKVERVYIKKQVICWTHSEHKE